VKKEKEITDSKTRLDAMISDLKLDADAPKVDSKVVVGNIIQDIGKIAGYDDATLIVMGTHGAKGLQRLLGSNAIRVITNSGTPFLVVQDKMPSNSKIDRIVMPIDLAKESIQILKFAVDLAKQFGAEIHVVGSHQSDEWLINKVRNNITNVRNYLKKHNISFSVKSLEGKKSYQEEVIQYAQEVGADLMDVAYYSESILPQFDTFAQSLITNELKMPVLIVDANEIGQASGQYSFLSV
jgi:nucleotide-binding universal stress UspA family protein